MLQVWLLWIIVVIGGFYMGIGSALSSYERGFDIPLALNAVVYLGAAVYGLPKFVKFARSRLLGDSKQ